MKRNGTLALTAALLLGTSAGASECTLAVGGETLEFPYVFAVAQANSLDPSKQDAKLYCFREPVPEDEQSASEILWAHMGDRIMVEISAEGHVLLVMATTPELSVSISGLNFGVDFDGTWKPGGKLRGGIETSEDLGDDEPWRLTADLDVAVMTEE